MNEDDITSKNPAVPDLYGYDEYDEYDEHEQPTIPTERVDPWGQDTTAGRRRPGPPPRRPSAPPPRRTKKRNRGRWGCFKTGLAITAMALAAILGAALVTGLLIYSNLSSELAEDMERLESMEGVEDFETTRIYDRSGEVLLYEIFTEGRRTEVSIDRIPFAMRWAVVATEDDTFYENPGFDPQSILRAAYQWYQEGEIVSGGSTITQQLVKQIVFEPEERLEQTLRRKLKEAALAWVMTQQMGKDQILELYLNEVYLGNLAYGVEGAADVYFDKHATELTIAESAFLAGLIQSPATYDPYTNFATAKARQRQVLDLMVRHGYLTPTEADTAFNERPVVVTDLANPDVSLLAPHFTVEVRRQLAELPGMDPEVIARGGLNIYTTIDMDMQELGEQIIAERIAEVGDEFNLHNAALVAIHPVTGEVLAMVGSVDYHDEAIDGAVNNILSPHQPGSTMKPLTYSAAMEQGWQPADVLWDVPIVFDIGIGEYEPVNYDERFHGPVRLRDGLANSYNIPAVLLVREIGVESLLEIAQRFGVESLGDDPSQYGLSLTLGGGEVKPIEMAQAFSVFANGGHRINPVMITRVEDNSGNILYEVPPQAGEEVLDPRIAFMISDILSDNAARTPAMGSESELLLGFPAAAKTGTTNDFHDNWTIGYTPHLVVAVWAGNTDNTAMAEGTSGLTGAAPIWHDYMTGVYSQPGIEGLLVNSGMSALRTEFTPPNSGEGLEQKQVCILSTLRDPVTAADGCPRTRSEWFRILSPDEATPTPAPTQTPIPTPEPGADPITPLPEMRREVEPGIWQLGVIPLDEEQQGELVTALVDVWAALPDSAPRPAAPIYCEVPQIPPEGKEIDVNDISLQWFIQAPSNPIDAIFARNWAIANGYPIEPGVGCSDALLEDLQQADVAIDPLTGATYFIEEPDRNDEVYGVLPITGTALFDPNRIAYYKLEIGAGDIPDEFVTLGDVHESSVVDGELESLHADALAPGPYVLQLVLVKSDGQTLPPYQVQIMVVPAPTPAP